MEVEEADAVSSLLHSTYRVSYTELDDDRNDRDRDGGRYGKRDHRGGRPPPPQDDRRPQYQGVPTGPRADRGKGSAMASGSSTPSMPPPPPPATNGSGAITTPLTTDSQDYVPPMTDNDLSAIRSRYLGVDKKKRKIRKMNDRKFVFDWDEQDDTFSAEAPAAVGSQRQGAQVMFGRGHIAGMDDGGGVPIVKKNGADGAAPMQLADPLERRKATKTGIDERHWTEKSLEEMKERDWRIFREDFSIAARGKSPYCSYSHFY